jgi:hypothetical protein
VSVRLDRNYSVVGFWGDGAVEAQLADSLGELSDLSVWRLGLEVIGTKTGCGKGGRLVRVPTLCPCRLKWEILTLTRRSLCLAPMSH